MDTAHPPSHSHLFTVRVWREDLGHSQTEWRGEVRYFRAWPTLLTLLHSMLPQQEGSGWPERQVENQAKECSPIECLRSGKPRTRTHVASTSPLGRLVARHAQCTWKEKTHVNRTRHHLVRRRGEGSHNRKRDVFTHLLATTSVRLFRTGKAMIAWVILAFQQLGRRMKLSCISRNRMTSVLPVPAPGEASSENRVPAGSVGTAATPQRRAFVLGVVQPGLAGLMDGSISSLAPLFAAAFATRDSHTVFLVGLATAISAGVSMAFSEGLSDDGTSSGRGSPWVRGTVCGLMTFVGAVGHTLPFLIPAFLTAALIVGGVVIEELLLIAWIRHRYMDTPWLWATFQVVIGGVMVFGAGF